ncbi:hypothetical protein BS329_11590 [Amycolatopsis coloradensis]|uniref:Uncharacterized protein n=1 Tax=Amycolatopsis coloradensis TaxID=76021 RepID=A0A1R0KWM9_9PSEU|nr:hypothetical protein BS329_11590 [Amycolatopsis coloradensis]
MISLFGTRFDTVDRLDVRRLCALIRFVLRRLGYELDSAVVRLKELFDLPSGEHGFEDAAVVGVGQTDEVAG